MVEKSDMKNERFEKYYKAQNILSDDEHERDLVVSELQFVRQLSSLEAGKRITCLLSEADARSGVEREEDERVGREVLGRAPVEEAVRVEFLRWVQW